MVGRTILCLALGGVLPVLAQGAADLHVDALMDFMYAKLAASYGTDPAGTPGREFLILAHPGFPLAPDQLKDDGFVGRLVDEVPRPKRFHTPGTLRYYQFYGWILEHALFSRFENQAKRQKGIRARDTLWDRHRKGRPTATYARYLDLETAWAAKADALALALSEQKATGKAVGDLAARTREVDALKQALDTDPAAIRVRAATSDLADAYASSPSTMVQAMQEKLRNHMRIQEVDGTSVTYGEVLFSPPMESWLTGSGWHPWTFQQADLKGQPPEPGSPAPGSAARGRPQATPAWNAALTLKVQLKRVRISRPWLDMALFRSRGWKLPNSGAYRKVSTGRLGDPDPGPMPVVVTGILLARNLTLTWNDGAADPAPDQVGPFTVAKGGRSRRDTTTAGSVITVPDPQIVAFFCDIVPKSPDPDPALFR